MYCFALKHRVAVLNLSYGHISKTKEDRPIVTEEHYIEVCTADLLLHSDPSQTPSLGKCSAFRYKTCSNINTASFLTIASDRSCCQPKQTFSRRKQIHEGIGPNPRFGTVKL